MIVTPAGDPTATTTMAEATTAAPKSGETELAAPHERTGEGILGVTVPSPSSGPHTLVALAHRDGETVTASRTVTPSGLRGREPYRPAKQV